MLNPNWNENDWTWEKSLLLLHRFVGVGEKTNIFRHDIPDELNEEVDNIQGISGSNNHDNQSKLLDQYPAYMLEVALSLGAPNTSETKLMLDQALDLGLALNQLLTGSKFKKRSQLKKDEVEPLKLELSLLKWMEDFDRFKLKTDESTNLINRNENVWDNLKNLKKLFPKRAFANYILWRVIDFATQFLDDEAQDKVIKLYRQSFGVLDKEQRWKLCTRMTNKYAALASGSLYIREYFPNASRFAAIEMAEMTIEEFKRTIKVSDWMDEIRKEEALKTVEDLKVFMGYDERLLDIQEVENYYGQPYVDWTGSFLYLGLQLNVRQADKAFKHRNKIEYDWTVYARPTSDKASYDKKENSICRLKCEPCHVENFSGLLKAHECSNKISIMKAKSWKY